MMNCPLSPAFSACDSLAEIDDLDAFLNAQGQLSQWPTPPPGNDEVTIVEAELDSEHEDDGLEYAHLARVFARETKTSVKMSQLDIELVQAIFVRAQLPPEVLALAFNILCALECYSLPAGSFVDSGPADLVVVSALSLAAVYTSDRPPSYSYWALVCDCMWTAARIDKEALRIMSALDWQILALTSPVALERGMAMLLAPIEGHDAPVQIMVPSAEFDDLDCKPPVQRRIQVKESPTIWVHGQLTPEGTPPPPWDGVENHFLPLL